MTRIRAACGCDASGIATHNLLDPATQETIGDYDSSGSLKTRYTHARTAEFAVLERGQAAAIGEVLLVVHGISGTPDRTRSLPTPPLVPSASPGQDSRGGATVVSRSATRRIPRNRRARGEKLPPGLLAGRDRRGKEHVVAEAVHRRSQRPS